MRVYACLFATWTVAWFLPALDLGPGAEQIGPAGARASSLLRGLGDASDDPGLAFAASMADMSADGVVAGHEAAGFVWDVFRLGVRDGADVGEHVRNAWWNLANPLFVLGLALVLLRQRRHAALVVTVAAVASSYWLFQDDMAEKLGLGYWMWFGSMAAAAGWSWCAWAADRRPDRKVRAG